MIKNRGLSWGVLGLGILWSAIGYGVGYDKPVAVSGRYSGIGNAVTSSVVGAESLFLNPAGLASSSSTGFSGEGTLNFSPSIVKFKGPITASGTQTDSQNTFLPVAGVEASYQVCPKWGVGVGYSAVGGSVADYGDVNYSSLGFTAFKPTVKGDLRISEMSVGTGVTLIPGLKIGASWRVTFVSAELSSASTATGALIEAHLKDLKDTNYKGFRLGAQYSPEGSSWGVGLNFRNTVNFIGKGTGEGRIESPLAPGVITSVSGTDITAANSFPMVVSVGGHYDFWSSFRGYLDYSWFNYSHNKFVDINGTLSNSAGTVSIPLPDTAQSWKNAHFVRLAGEYSGIEGWPLRFGFGLATPTVAKSTAQSIFEAPGTGNFFTVGTGHSFLNQRLEANLGLDYSLSHGKVESADANGNLTGSYAVDIYSVHTGVTYRF